MPSSLLSSSLLFDFLKDFACLLIYLFLSNSLKPTCGKSCCLSYLVSAKFVLEGVFCQTLLKLFASITCLQYFVIKAIMRLHLSSLRKKLASRKSHKNVSTQRTAKIPWLKLYTQENVLEKTSSEMSRLAKYLVPKPRRRHEATVDCTEVGVCRYNSDFI